jgi:signal transduction histidine kinase/transcriptional regulator with GAF, ATPase, and Fis domain
MLVADREFVEDLDAADEDSLLTFAGVAAAAIETKHLQNFRSLYAASRKLMSPAGRDDILGEMLADLQLNVSAAALSCIFVDAKGLPTSHRYVGAALVGNDVQAQLDDLSAEVVRTGRWRTFEAAPEAGSSNREPPKGGGFLAAACLPLQFNRTMVGVLWVYYSAVHHFSREELEMLALHGQHLAIAFGNAERIKAAKIVQQGWADVSRPIALEEVRAQIAATAASVFRADVTVLWPYDAERGTFMAQDTASHGLSAAAVHELRRHPPLAGHTTEFVVAQQWVSEVDIASQEPPYMDKRTRQFLIDLGIVAFQASRLQIGDELLGVLYLSYDAARQFTEEDTTNVLTFCHFSALALKRAKLFEQLEASTTAAQEVARKTVLEDLDATLHAVALAIQAALDCQAVVVYNYDSDSKTISYPPTSVGVDDPARIQQHRALPHNSLVRNLLARDELYPVPDAAKDEFLRDAPFRTREGVVSCVIAPLKAGGRKVGIVFVNYRYRHHFRQEELIKIEFFANQAATAIRNAQLFRTLSQKLREQTDLAELSHSLLDTLNLQETLDQSVTAARRVFRTEFSNLVLDDPQSGDLIFAAAVGWDPSLVGTQRLERGAGSHAGYVIRQGHPVGIEDFDAQELPFKILTLARDMGIRSALAVPISHDHSTIGALLVQSTSPRLYTEADERMLQLIADQTAIAIKAARQFEMLERRSAHLAALAEAGEMLVMPGASGEPERILSRIVRGALKSMTPGHRRKLALGTLQLYDADNDQATITAIETLPPDLHSSLRIHIGQTRSLRAADALGERIGITGRVILTGESKILWDVTTDPDYIAFADEVRSEIAVAIFHPPKAPGEKRAVLGAISLESDLLAAFDAEDLRNLDRMARLAEALIQKAALDARTERLLREADSLNRKLQDLDRRKTEWIRFVSHELRTPLKPLQSLLEDQINNRFGYVHEKLRERLDHNLEMIHQQSHLIENLLARVRIEGGITTLSLGLGNVGSIMKLVFRTFSESAKRRKIDLILSVDDSASCAFIMDSRKTEHVISNLVSNALKFTPPGGKVEMYAIREDDNMVVRVRDTGRGISPEIRDRIFELHFQARPADANSGIGLGLSIVKSFVEMHGGQVGFNTTRKIGTEFWFRLPIVQPPPPTRPQHTSLPGGSQNGIE